MTREGHTIEESSWKGEMQWGEKAWYTSMNGKRVVVEGGGGGGDEGC